MTDLPSDPSTPDRPVGPTPDPVPTAKPEPAVAPEPALTAEPGEPKPKKKKGKKKRKVVVEEVTPAWVRPAAIVAVVLLGVAAFVAVRQTGTAGDLRHDAKDRTAAERTAGQFTATLYTWTSTDPTASLDDLESLSTAAYRPRISEARQSALAPDAKGAPEGRSTATVTEVYLTDLHDGTAHAVARADWELTSGDEHLGIDLYLLFDLKREGGRWKVDEVRSLATKPLTGDAPGTSPSTTSPSTTAPAGAPPSTAAAPSTTAAATP